MSNLVPEAGRLSSCLAFLSFSLAAVTAAAWIPQGDTYRPVAAECSASSVAARFSKSGSFPRWAENLRTQLRACDPSFRALEFDSVRSLIEFARIEYDPSPRKGIQSIRFRLRDGREVRGLLGLRNGSHPLIVARCGVYCDAEAGTSASLVFPHFFEEGNFHVLLLNSTTGPQYAQDNEALTIGGFDEGAQTFEILEQLSKDARLSPRISEFHLFGMSLGGHGTLYAALYASRFPERLSKPLRSAVAMCPVVDLEPQLRAAFSDSPRGLFYSYLTRDLFTRILHFVPLLGEALRPSTNWDRPHLLKTILSVSEKYYARRFSELGVAANWPTGQGLLSSQKFVQLNRFQNYASEMKVPTLVVAARDDLLVPTAINAQKLLNRQNNALQVIELQEGSHCAFDLALGWPTYGQILRSFYQSHSAQPSQSPRHLPWRFSPMASETTLAQTRWNVNVGSSNVDLSLVSLVSYLPSEPDGVLCSAFPPGAAPTRCYNEEKMRIPLAVFAGLGVPTQARSAEEAGRIARFFNSQASLTDERGQGVLGSSRTPTHIQVRANY